MDKNNAILVFLSGSQQMAQSYCAAHDADHIRWSIFGKFGGAAFEKDFETGYEFGFLGKI